MQRIHDLSQSELIALTNEQVERYIDVECLIAGVPLFPSERPVEPLLQKPEAKTQYISIGNFHFSDPEQAAQVLDLLGKCDLYATTTKYKGGETFTVVSPLRTANDWMSEKPTMKTNMGFTDKEWTEVEKQAEEFGRERDRYRTIKKEYDDISGKRSKVTTEVWSIVTEARDLHDERTKLIGRFGMYLDLADGDHSEAWKYFVAAHDNEIESHEGLHDELLRLTASNE